MDSVPTRPTILDCISTWPPLTCLLCEKSVSCGWTNGITDEAIPLGMTGFCADCMHRVTDDIRAQLLRVCDVRESLGIPLERARTALRTIEDSPPPIVGMRGEALDAKHGFEVYGVLGLSNHSHAGLRSAPGLPSRPVFVAGPIQPTILAGWNMMVDEMNRHMERLSEEPIAWPRPQSQVFVVLGGVISPHDVPDAKLVLHWRHDNPVLDYGRKIERIELLSSLQLKALLKAGRDLLTTKNLGGRPQKLELSDIDRIVEDYRGEHGEFPTKERVAERANVSAQTISNILERERKGTYTDYVASAPPRTKRARTISR